MKDTDKSELREQREQAIIMLFQKEFHEPGEIVITSYSIHYTKLYE